MIALIHMRRSPAPTPPQPLWGAEYMLGSYTWIASYTFAAARISKLRRRHSAAVPALASSNPFLHHLMSAVPDTFFDLPAVPTPEAGCGGGERPALGAGSSAALPPPAGDAAAHPSAETAHRGKGAAAAAAPHQPLEGLPPPPAWPGLDFQLPQQQKQQGGEAPPAAASAAQMQGQGEAAEGAIAAGGSVEERGGGIGEWLLRPLRALFAPADAAAGASGAGAASEPAAAASASPASEQQEDRRQGERDAEADRAAGSGAPAAGGRRSAIPSSPWALPVAPSDAAARAAAEQRRVQRSMYLKNFWRALQLSARACSSPHPCLRLRWDASLVTLRSDPPCAGRVLLLPGPHLLAARQVLRGPVLRRPRRRAAPRGAPRHPVRALPRPAPGAGGCGFPGSWWRMLSDRNRTWWLI